MNKAILAIILGLLSVTAHAQTPQGILAWIAKTTPQPPLTLGDGKIVSYVVERYEGCTVTVDENLVASRTESVSTGLVIPVYGLDPDQVVVRQISNGDAQYYLSVAATTPVIFSSSRANGNSKASSVGWWFADKDLADRFSRAWHDAIVGCGGKSVNPNLY
jgi:hypothetical protein